VAAEARPAGVGHRLGGGRWLVRGQEGGTKKARRRTAYNTTWVDGATVTCRHTITFPQCDVEIVEQCRRLYDIIQTIMNV